MAAQQDYQSKSRQLDSTYVADIQKFRLDVDKSTAAARLAVFQKELDDELKGIDKKTGKELAAEEASLKARRASALASGDTGRADALSKGIDQIEKLKSDNLKAFRDELVKAGTSARDLRIQLDNVASTPLEKALSGAAGPFNAILKTARDNVAALDAAFKKLTPGQQASGQGAALRSQEAEQTRIILAANQQRNQALLTARQAYDRAIADKSADASAKLAKTEFDGRKITESTYDRLLDAASTYWQHRLAVAVKGSADEDTATQKLADLQAERDRARTVTQAQTDDNRTLIREEVAGNLALATSDRERAVLRSHLRDIDTARLGQVNAEILRLQLSKGSQADINKLIRERIGLQGTLNTAEQEEKTRTEALLASQLSLTNAEAQRQAVLARSYAEVQASKAAAVRQVGSELSDVSRRIAEAQAQGKAQADINALLTEYTGKETALFQAQRDAAGRDVLARKHPDQVVVAAAAAEAAV